MLYKYQIAQSQLIIRHYDSADFRCFVRYPYGLASFYGPVVIAVLIIWGLFFSVARVIMRAMAAKSKQKGESDLAMRRVSGVIYVS